MDNKEPKIVIEKIKAELFDMLCEESAKEDCTCDYVVCELMDFAMVMNVVEKHFLGE